jgi:methionine-rich copper-binding protein CopC
MPAKMMSIAKFVLALSAVLYGTAGTALAHAVLLEAVPPLHGAVAGPQVVFHLRFNLRIDAARSALKLVLPDGKVRPVAMGPQSSPDSLNARSEQLTNGQYLLRWQVLAADGHITRGEIAFEVR